MRQTLQVFARRKSEADPALRSLARAIRAGQRPELDVTLDLRREGIGQRDVPRYDEGVIVVFVKLDFEDWRLSASIEEPHIVIALAGVAVFPLTRFIVVSRQGSMRAGKPAKLHFLDESVLDIRRRTEGQALWL